MSLPPEQAQRYLLGELPPEEEAEIDARLLGDEATLEALEIAEDELHDAHARGELGAVRERAYAERFSLARSRLRAAVARELVARRKERRPLAPARRRWAWLGGGTALAAAAAAALFFVLRPTPEPALLELRAPMRGEEVAARALPAGAGEVRLAPELDTPPVAGDRYRLTLTSNGIAVAPAREGDAAVLVLPARALPPGTYELRVERRRGGGDFVDVGRFPFRIAPP